MAGSTWQPSWTSLTTKAPIVDYLVTCRFHLNFKTAFGVRRHLKKKPIIAGAMNMLEKDCMHASYLRTSQL